MKTGRNHTDSGRVLAGAGADEIPANTPREDLCERIEERLAGLHRRLVGTSRNERRWLPGV